MCREGCCPEGELEIHFRGLEISLRLRTYQGAGGGLRGHWVGYRGRCGLVVSVTKGRGRPIGELEVDLRGPEAFFAVQDLSRDGGWLEGWGGLGRLRI
jgi:hypothetical protein